MMADRLPESLLSAHSHSRTFRKLLELCGDMFFGDLVGICLMGLVRDWSGIGFGTPFCAMALWIILWIHQQLIL